MKVCIIIGARPNFIKVAPLVKAVEKAQKDGKEIECKLIYAGTENDATVEKSLFDDIQIRRPDVFLNVDCENLNELTGMVMAKFDSYLSNNPTDIVIVVDDLASTMAASIVTKKHGVALAHLVAGTRSFDIKMPKEVNRLVIDGLSDYLFTAGMGSSSIVSREGAELSHVFEVGNILMDTLRNNHDKWRKPSLFEEYKFQEKGYILFTLNRKALISQKENLKEMLRKMSSSAGNTPIIAPLRGKAKSAVEEMKEDCPNIKVVDALPYLEFGYLAANAMGIVTDSGNVAEEATFNNVPCITLNSYTEHIETVKQGTNVLVGEDAEKLGKYITDIIENNWKKSSLPDRWDGRTADRIVHILLDINKKSQA